MKDLDGQPAQVANLDWGRSEIFSLNVDIEQSEHSAPFAYEAPYSITGSNASNSDSVDLPAVVE